MIKGFVDSSDIFLKKRTALAPTANTTDTTPRNTSLLDNEMDMMEAGTPESV